MKYFRVTAPFLKLAGTLHLTDSQYLARKASLTPIGKGGSRYSTTEPVGFKFGETLGFDGEVDPSSVEQLHMDSRQFDGVVRGIRQAAANAKAKVLAQRKADDEARAARGDPMAARLSRERVAEEADRARRVREAAEAAAAEEQRIAAAAEAKRRADKLAEARLNAQKLRAQADTEADVAIKADLEARAAAYDQLATEIEAGAPLEDEAGIGGFIERFVAGLFTKA